MLTTLRSLPVCPVSGQNRKEEWLNSLSHGLGLVAVIAGSTVLIVLASLNHTPWHIVSVSIFGASLILLYGISTLYHSVRRERTKRILQVVDHAAVFLLIAGTYTPFTLVSLRGGWGWSIFGVVWGFAVVGIVFKLFFTGRFERLSILFYLAMGWVIIIAIVPLSNAIPLSGILWLLAGGIAYSTGTVFYLLDRRVPYFHTVFHLLVITGSACHYYTVLHSVL